MSHAKHLIKSEIESAIQKPNMQQTRKELSGSIAKIEALIKTEMETMYNLSETTDVSHQQIHLLMAEVNDITKIMGDAKVALAELKEGKHKEESATITALPADQQGRALHRAFERGDHKTVGSFIKQGSEYDVKISRVEGKAPSAKLEEMEKVFSSLLNDYENTTVDIEEDNQNIISVTVKTAGGEEIKFLQKDFDDMDFSQVTVTDEDLGAYKTALGEGKTFFSPATSPGSRTVPTEAFFARQEASNGVTDSNLDYGHKLAINIYSGPGYAAVNSTLRGLTVNKLDTGEAILPSVGFKEGFLHGVIALKGMELLPDYGGKALFRAEGSAFKDLNILNQYKDAVDNGEGYILNKGFLSAAKGKPVPDFSDLNRATAFMLVKNPEGKNVMPWSQFPAESEVLSAPSPTKIAGYKDVVINGKTVTFFICKPTNVNMKEPPILDSYVKANKSMELAMASMVHDVEPPPLSKSSWSFF